MDEVPEDGVPLKPLADGGDAETGIKLPPPFLLSVWSCTGKCMVCRPIDSNTNASLGEITKTIEVNHGQFLEFHIYLTSALSKKDFRAVGLQYALQLLKNNDNKDAITGLKVFMLIG